MREVSVSFSRRAAFAFEIAAGKFADCRRFFAIINRERKPILAFLDLSGGDGAGKHDGVAAGDDDGAVGEFGDFAGFDGDLRGPDLGRDLVLHNCAFWNVANSRPVTLIVGFNPASVSGLKPLIKVELTA